MLDQSEPFIAERLIVIEAQGAHDEYDMLKAEKVIVTTVLEAIPTDEMSARSDNNDEGVSLDAEASTTASQSTSENTIPCEDHTARISSLVEETVTQDRSDEQARQKVAVNAQRQRVDESLEWFDVTLFRQRNYNKQLCAHHHLGYGCTNQNCARDHDPADTDVLKGLLMLTRRSLHCINDDTCRRLKCFGGHQCAYGRRCTSGDACKFSNVHGKDTVVADYVDAEG